MKKRILIIDDEPEFTYMLRRSLEVQGYYEVGEENDDSVAQESAHYFDPDLIVLDIMMPHVDGSELAARFREDPILRDVPIIFLTALIDHGDAPEGACDRGGHTFLPKNTPLDKLIECIEEKLRHAPLLAG